MDSNENQQSVDQQHPKQPLSLTSKLRPFAFYAIPIIILSIAIPFTNKTHFFPTILNPKSQKPTSNSPQFCLLWMSPFLSGGGYSSEGWSYISALHRHLTNPNFKLAIDHHGDSESLQFWDGLPGDLKSLASELHATKCAPKDTVVICHSEPGAWNPPLFETRPCPPSDRRDFKAVIGRTMFETDRVNPEHVKRLNRMDFVWVPTEFHVSTFAKSGVNPWKVSKIVQAVDVGFFDPGLHDPLELDPIGELVIGEKTRGLDSSSTFVFLSVFKWEFRKGWDILLKSYLTEFSGDDDVALFLLTNPYHSDQDFGNKIAEFVANSRLEKPANGWARIHISYNHIAQTDLPRLYKAVDAFALPTRGEGWGRPVVEAMAMALPVIVTNWSGPTEYLTEENSYPLPVNMMSEVIEGPFKGHLWAEPSVGELRVLMRRVMENVEEAKGKGRKAREDMIRRFSPEIVANIVADRVQDILENSNR